ncbi:DUF1513 domain-containing protein [Actibacterium lipolyticum]|uniref:DUF1513 domain-containing protein n=1 Tax=Actibacterium lipolyticum TaxID=1524263 RepID=A0A238KN23_9RHOB|nr:DUF1513 domain-containing protein [Actibacterium lipolyticum]SMX44214.1 hypothetical protein COL8621_02500 [Actibacterium lipolyticum]
MTTRRHFLAGMLATGLAPAPSWADAGSPMHLAAAKMPSGDYRLFGLSQTGAAVFSLPLPDRGHAAAAHPHRPEAVAFARRPGTFAIVIDCRSGTEIATLSTPQGRHFYGHGAFSADGRLLFTTENDFDAGEGRIGVWDRTAGYTRVGEFASGGVGPHEITRLPGTDTLVIANGGIETHPDAGRAKLNIPTMRPNLTYTDLNGHVLDQLELPENLHKNSIRHLAVRDDGLTAFAMQWQGGAGDPPLLGLHRMSQAPVLLQADKGSHQRMQGYAGSVAFSSEADRVAITSPRGGLIQVFDCATNTHVATIAEEDVCGVSAGPTGFTTTAGNGTISHLSGVSPTATTRHDAQWDNHLVRITG